MRQPGRLALALLLAAPTGAAGAAGASIDGWGAIRADFAGPYLAYTDSATVRVEPRDAGRGLPSGLRPFTYYRSHGARIRLDRRRLGFSGRRQELVFVRTQIAPLGAGGVAGAADGSFVMAPRSGRFAAPVIWCCDSSATERVLLSDGREDAARPIAIAADRQRVVAVLRASDGSAVLTARPHHSDPVRELPLPGAPAVVAVTAGRVAWVDSERPSQLQVADHGPAGLGTPRTTTLPGPARALWADGGVVVSASRRGRATILMRHDLAAGRDRRIWSGRDQPHVAVGEGQVAVGSGRTVLAGRGIVRPVWRARGRIAGVAAERRRVAWFSRIRVRGVRVTVVRVRRVP